MDKISDLRQIVIKTLDNNKAQDIKSKIEGKTIKIEMESNDEGNLYGAVTQKSIVENILGSMSIKLSTDSVILTPIKALGTNKIKIHLYDEVYANINIKCIKFVISKPRIIKTQFFL